MGATANLMTISVANGYYYSTSTSEITERHQGLVVTDDCVISSWTAINASGTESVDLVAKFNISGKTITTDFPPLIIPSGLYSESITLSTNGGVCY